MCVLQLFVVILIHLDGNLYSAPILCKYGKGYTGVVFDDQRHPKEHPVRSRDAAHTSCLLGDTAVGRKRVASAATDVSDAGSPVRTFRRLYPQPVSAGNLHYTWLCRRQCAVAHRRRVDLTRLRSMFYLFINAAAGSRHVKVTLQHLLRDDLTDGNVSRSSVELPG